MKNYLIGMIAVFLAFILQMAGCRDGAGMLPPLADPQAQETEGAFPDSREAGIGTGSFFERIAAATETTASEQTSAETTAETTATEVPVEVPAATEAPAPTEPVYVPEPTQPVYTEPEPVYVEPTEPPTEAPMEPPTAPPTEAPTEPPTQPPTEPEPVTAPPTEAPTEPVHVHSWEPVYSYIHHDAEYVHHDAVTQTETWTEQVLVSDAWDEPVYEIHSFCSACGVDLTILAMQQGVDYVDHSLDEHDGASGWSAQNVQVDTIHHDAVYNTITHEELVTDQEAYDEMVADAWDEPVLEGYMCSECGEWQ